MWVVAGQGDGKVAEGSQAAPRVTLVYAAGSSVIPGSSRTGASPDRGEGGVRRTQPALLALNTKGATSPRVEASRSWKGQA